MKMTLLRTFTFLLAGSIAFYSCTSNSAQSSEQTEAEPVAATAEAEPASSGVQFENVELSTPLNADWVTAGKGIYEMKCQSCHKLTDEKLVGPGWKGVTQKRKAGWILAMITKPEEMLKSDPDAKKLLEEMLVAMPNQNITNEEARKLIEFMRSNDGVK